MRSRWRHQPHEDAVLEFQGSDLQGLEELRNSLAIRLWIDRSARRRRLRWGEVRDSRSRFVDEAGRRHGKGKDTARCVFSRRCWWYLYPMHLVCMANRLRRSTGSPCRIFSLDCFPVGRGSQRVVITTMSIGTTFLGCQDRSREQVLDSTYALSPDSHKDRTPGHSAAESGGASAGK